MTVTLGLAGDTMLGRGVGEALRRLPPAALLADEVVDVASEADAVLVGLECCISDRGEPWNAPGKPFFFRAPPVATEVLRRLGVRCVTLANNHALDFGFTALADTLSHLAEAGIAAVGAGADVTRARRPVILEVGGFRLGVLGVTDHPRDFAATDDRPGVAYADLRSGVPPWLLRDIATLGRSVDAVLVSPHWGPNMTARPVPHVRAAAEALVEAGATLVAGHSAHVFHGVAGRVLFDLGDFLDDYAVDPVLRNDLGLFWLLSVDESGPRRLEGVPLKLEFCHTRIADGEDARWIADRFHAACAELGTTVEEQAGRLVIDWPGR